VIDQTLGRRRLAIARNNQCYDEEEGLKPDKDDIALIEEAMAPSVAMANDNEF
jgi:hypothetical protein